MSTAIRLTDVSKRFRIVRQRPFLARAVIQRILQRPSSVEWHWALKDINFEIDDAEFFRLIAYVWPAMVKMKAREEKYVRHRRLYNNRIRRIAQSSFGTPSRRIPCTDGGMQQHSANTFLLLLLLLP